MAENDYLATNDCRQARKKKQKWEGEGINYNYLWEQIQLQIRKSAMSACLSIYTRGSAQQTKRARRRICGNARTKPSGWGPKKAEWTVTWLDVGGGGAVLGRACYQETYCCIPCFGGVPRCAESRGSGSSVQQSKGTVKRKIRLWKRLR